ncbi:MAG: RNA polymerase sigma factor [Spirochaetota bacterium]|nr:MAG: RNA polymerase sigma factor [Spirochaetota bacterium]
MGQSYKPFDEILNNNKDRIFNLLFRLTGNYHLTEDLFQEAFLKVYRGLDRYEGRAKSSTWVYSIALNVYRDYWRRGLKARFNTGIVDVSSLSDKDPADDPEAVFIRNEEKAELQRIIVSLKPALRVPVVLFYIEGMAVGEIAIVTGRSESSIKVALYRARKILKKGLGREK